jgi:hypothetical protein
VGKEVIELKTDETTKETTMKTQILTSYRSDTDRDTSQRTGQRHDQLHRKLHQHASPQRAEPKPLVHLSAAPLVAQTEPGTELGSHC